MKRKLLSLIKMVSKNLLYGIIIQCLLLSSLMAEESNAQIKPLDKAFVKMSHQPRTVRSLFDEMESKTAYVFVYPDDLLQDTPSVTLERGKKSVEEVLIEIGKATNLKFKQVNNSVYVGKNIQNRTDAVEIAISEIELKGVVTDETGNPLPGVAIVEKGTTNGTVTDLDGNYSINVQEGSALVISYVGYKSQTVQVGSSTQLDVILEEDLGDLEEVVVVG